MNFLNLYLLLTSKNREPLKIRWLQLGTPFAAYYYPQTFKPMGVSWTSAMIPKPIRAVFRWWAKHPWIVFWGNFLVFGVIESTLHPLSVFVGRTISLLFFIVIILSFIRGMFLICRRSKFGPLKALLLIVVPVMAIAAMAIPRYRVHRLMAYKREVRLDLMRAADAQKLYFDKNNSYKSCAPCAARNLPGYNNNPKVTLVAEIGRRDFVLVATHERCGDSQWIYQRSTGKITGPNAIDSCKWRP